MRGFFKAIWRQRRRTLTGIFGILFVMMITANTDYPIFEGSPVWIVVATLVIMTPLLGGAIVALIFVIPSIRNIVEALTVAWLVEISIYTFFPAIKDILASYGVGSVLWLAIWLTIYFFLYGTLSDRLPGWFSYKGRARFVTTATPEQVLAATMPSKENEASYHSGAMEYVGPDPVEEDSFHVRYKLGESFFEHQRITMLEHEPGKRGRYYFMGDVSAKNADFAEGIYDVTVTDLGNGKTRVEIFEERPHQRLRHALWSWFDDHVGDSADSIRAKLEGRADWSFEGRRWRQVAKLA